MAMLTLMAIRVGTSFATSSVDEKRISNEMEGRMAEGTNPLEELLIDELKDIYSAENQIVKALPKMATAATSDELRTAFEEHL